ncbi:MAG: apolipoprotein N-acyltransferase [Hyphomonadaceae bacterium]|nr:MAG: apolipoprotein N-acyltransferase [Caulobacteraceae bacterium]MBT9444436.1 apolipoprotein N-acyltransferase [Hyphomonadaceae bacterium]TPW06388.1 MAG: apolipoprotein N-acyltransferase [Alphaproteobacteria bacterium]
MRVGDERTPALSGIQLWIDQLPRWRMYVAAMAVGAFSALAFAPFYITPALAVGLCFLVWMIDGAARHHRPMRAAFGRGWMFAFGHFLAGTYWVGAAFTQVDGAMALMPLGVIGLPALLAVFWGLASMVAVRLWTADSRRIAVIASMLMFAELVRGHLFGGFPWNLAGYTWEAGTALSQGAAFVGIYGLTAITLLILATPATLADSHRGWALRATPVMIGALLLGLLWGAGAERLETAGPVNPRAGGAIVRVVDPGYTQREKWTEGREHEVLARYLELTGPAAGANSEVVVWPEGAIPARYPEMPVLMENPDMLDAIGETLGDRVLIIGATRLEYDSKGAVSHFYNSGVVVDGVSGQAEVRQWHDKNRLTPFGEFIPLFNLVEWLNIPTLQQIGTGFTPGEPPSRVVIPGAEDALILICYESIFPGLVPHGAERPGWIANISIDAWYGDGTGPWQNDNQSRYRAIEEGLPMARAASGGISSITDAYGRKVVSVGRKGGAVEAALPVALPETINVRFGWLLTPLLILLIAFLRFAPPGAPARGFRS